MKRYHKKCRNYKSEKGSISVFLCIVMAGIIFFNCVLIDSARLVTLDDILKQRLDLCAESLLADFLTELQENYGLYGMYVPDISQAENDVYSYMSDGGVVSAASYDKDYRQMALFNYEVSGVDVKYGNSISEKDILSEQINNIMKYKTPANGLNYILEKLYIFSDSAEITDIYSVYTEAEAAKEKAVYAVSELKTLLCGSGGISINAVNGWCEYGLPFCEIQVEILEKTPYILSADGTIDTALGVNAFELLLTSIQNYKSYTESALTKANEVLTLQGETKDKIDEIKEKLENCGTESELGEEYRDSVSKMIDSLESFVKNTKYKTIMNQLNKNAGLFLNAETACTDGTMYLQNLKNAPAGNSKLKEYLLNIEELENIKSDFDVYSALTDGETDSELASYDKSVQKDTALSALFNSSEDKIITDSLYNILPSVQSGTAKDEESSLEKLFSGLSNTDASSMGSFNIGDCVSSIETAGKFALNAVYLNDYVMSYFLCQTDDSKRDGYFDAEIEYIIAGGRSQKSNVEDVLKQILSIRIVMNFIHILLDEKKSGFASEIGAAISAATFGVGAQLYSAAVMLCWAVIESVVYINNLKKVEAVPFYKKKGDWRTDIGLENIGSAYLEMLSDSETDKSVTSKESSMNMTYKDYLRLLLLFVPQDTAVNRIGDVVQLNLSENYGFSFKLNNVYTSVVCDCTVKIQGIFIGNADYGEKRRYYEMFFRSNVLY